MATHQTTSWCLEENLGMGEARTSSYSASQMFSSLLNFTYSHATRMNSNVFIGMLCHMMTWAGCQMTLMKSCTVWRRVELVYKRNHWTVWRLWYNCKSTKTWPLQDVFKKPVVTLNETQTSTVPVGESVGKMSAFYKSGYLGWVVGRKQLLKENHNSRLGQTCLSTN